MDTIDIRALAASDLDFVSGASDYKFCLDGPGGTGLYPWYTNCDPRYSKYDAFLKGIEEAKKAAGQT